MFPLRPLQYVACGCLLLGKGAEPRNYIVSQRRELNLLSLKPPQNLLFCFALSSLILYSDLRFRSTLAALLPTKWVLKKVLPLEQATTKPLVLFCSFLAYSYLCSE